MIVWYYTSTIDIFKKVLYVQYTVWCFLNFYFFMSLFLLRRSMWHNRPCHNSTFANFSQYTLYSRHKVIIYKVVKKAFVQAAHRSIKISRVCSGLLLTPLYYTLFLRIVVLNILAQHDKFLIFVLSKSLPPNLQPYICKHWNIENVIISKPNNLRT